LQTVLKLPVLFFQIFVLLIQIVDSLLVIINLFFDLLFILLLNTEYECVLTHLKLVLLCISSLLQLLQSHLELSGCFLQI